MARKKDQWKGIPHFLRPDVTPVMVGGIVVSVEKAEEPLAERGDTMTTKQAAKFLKLAPGTLEVWRSQGKGPRYHKAGGRVLYLPEDLREWLEGHQVSPSGRSPSGRSPR